MIFAKPGESFVAELDRAPQSLVGTIQVGIFLEPAGTAVTAYATSGITTENTATAEASYYAALTAPATIPAAGSKYVVKWKNGTTIVPEDLILTGLLSTFGAPSGTAVGDSFVDLYSGLVTLSGVSIAQAKSRINQAYRRFVEKSECIRAKVELGTGVNGQAAYDLDPSIIGVHDPVRFDGKRLERKAADDLDDLTASQAYTVGLTNGYYAPEYDAVGGGQLLIWPAPTQAGQSLTARVSLYPSDLVGDDEYPLVPVSFRSDLLTGAFGISLRHDDERFDEGTAMLAEMDQRAKECRSQLQRRVGAGGVARVRLMR